MLTILKKYKLHFFSTLVFLVINHFLSAVYQFIISFVLIFSFGLIHGANDIQLIQKKTVNYTLNFFIYSILLYILIVVLGITIFFYAPKFGLLFFIFFSAFHFGEQHLGGVSDKINNSFIKWIFFTAYGSAILGLLFKLQWDEVHGVISKISGVFIEERIMELYFFVGFVVFITTSLFFKELRKILFIEIILIFFLGFFFSRASSNASLLLSFSLYFVFWHSIPSILDQLNFLYEKDNSRKIKYMLSSMPYWFMSILGLLGFYFYFHTKPDTFLPLFFSFLAAITFPHTIVMGWLKIYKPKTKSKI